MIASLTIFQVSTSSLSQNTLTNVGTLNCTPPWVHPTLLISVRTYTARHLPIKIPLINQRTKNSSNDNHRLGWKQTMLLLCSSHLIRTLALLRLLRGESRTRALETLWIIVAWFPYVRALKLQERAKESSVHLQRHGQNPSRCMFTDAATIFFQLYSSTRTAKNLNLLERRSASK